MGLIKDKLNNLKESDIYSVMLFALAKLRDIPEYSGISELCYILDKSSIVKLCQVFGGLTIKIPTIEELETISYALLMYEYVDVHKIDYEEALKRISNPNINNKVLKETPRNFNLKFRGEFIYVFKSRGFQFQSLCRALPNGKYRR